MTDATGDPAAPPPGPPPGRDPVVSLGPVAAPVVRTGLQLGAGEFVVQGLEVWHVHTFDGAQRTWTVIALTLAAGWLQNVVETVRGRRLVGTDLVRPLRRRQLRAPGR